MKVSCRLKMPCPINNPFIHLNVCFILSFFFPLLSFAVSNSCDGNKQTNTWCRLVLVMGNCGKYPYNDLCCETCIAYAAPYNV